MRRHSGWSVFSPLDIPPPRSSSCRRHRQSGDGDVAAAIVRRLRRTRRPTNFSPGLALVTDRTKRFETLRTSGPQVLPSLLKCDFGDLKGEIERLEAAGTRALHLDVMDGHFVPNLTYGMPIVEGLRRHTSMPLDVHLMISEPVQYAEPMIAAGADLLTFHAEAVDDVAATVTAFRNLDVAVGVAVNPDTDLSVVEPVIGDVDMVLIMSVQAGFGGQRFRDEAVDRIKTVRRWRSDVLIEVDGGIDTTTIERCSAAGCDCFVVGSAIFNHDDYGPAIEQLNAGIAAGRRA